MIVKKNPDRELQKKFLLLNKINTILSSFIEIDEIVNVLAVIFIARNFFDFTQVYVLDVDLKKNIVRGNYCLGYKNIEEKKEAEKNAEKEKKQLFLYKKSYSHPGNEDVKIFFEELNDLTAFLSSFRLKKHIHSLATDKLLKDFCIDLSISNSLIKRVFQEKTPLLITIEELLEDTELQEIILPLPAVFFPIIINGKIRKVLIMNKTFSSDTEVSQLDMSSIEWIFYRLKFILENAHRYEMLKISLEKLKKVDEIKSNFLSLISHELKTPLINIIGFGHLLYNEKYGPINSEQKNILGKILKQSYILNNLIKNLLLYTQIESEVFPPNIGEKFSLIKLIRETIEEYKHHVYQKEVIFHLKVPEYAEFVVFDPETLKILVKILVDNAIKFSEDKVNIWISSGKIDDKHFFVKVRDDGIGIPEKELSKIFDIFYQVQNPIVREYAGLGIGLNLLKRIVKKLKGKILVKSKEKEGSTFKLMLPFMRE